MSAFVWISRGDNKWSLLSRAEAESERRAGVLEFLTPPHCPELNALILIVRDAIASGTARLPGGLSCG